MINIENRNKSLIIKDFLDNLKDEDIFISTLVEIKDSYYYVNNFGEEIFSKVLEELKISLGKCLKSYSFIYKEKKILLISKVDNSLRIRTQFKRIKRKFKRVNFAQNSSFNFSNLEFYIGITIDNKNHLIKNSSMALSFAKKKNIKNMVFSKKLIENVKDDEKNRKKEFEIKKAVLKGQVIPFYQKIIDNNTLDVFKYEALARIKFKDKILNPDIFMPAVKNLKLEDKFTREILKKVFSDVYEIKKIQAVSINININDITNKNTIELIRTLLKIYGGQSITFEIIETIGVEDYSILLDFTSMIKEYNSSISIDDFGSGHSGYEHLINLEIDYLKIDGKFIKNIKNNLKTQSLIKGLCNFSKEHNIKVIAEFVEDQDTFNLLKNIGVDFSQGYFFGKPTNIIKGNI
ncbi:MAG: EAL domain-containing protein [Sulfurimonadaceae bacterium]|nr:EAL domain-containing protein [Sulfurimonadaceae bacterium]